MFNNIDTNNVDSKSHSCAYPITTKRVVLTIVSSLDYEEGILSYLCKDGLSIEMSAIFFFSVGNLIKFSTQSINPKLKKD